MDRKTFLRRLGIGAGAIAVAPLIVKEVVEDSPEDISKGSLYNYDTEAIDWDNPSQHLFTDDGGVWLKSELEFEEQIKQRIDRAILFGHL